MSPLQGDSNDPLPDDGDQGWKWTAWVKVGKERWRNLGEKFWRVPPEVKRQRYGICRECEEFIPVTTQCRRCYCPMGIKTWYGGFACPKGKWPALSPPRHEVDDGGVDAL
ncbi:MAG: hypothetical protein WB783_16595 [Arenicellales bacterium]